MPNPTRRSALLLPLLCLPAQAAEIGPGPPLPALLALLATGGERRTGFTESRRFAALSQPLESRGHLVFRPGHLEKVTDWPEPERLEVDDDRLVLTQGNDPPRVVDLARVPELRVLIDAIRGPLSGDAAALARAFVATTAGTLDAWTLTLVPRDPAAARLLRDVQMAGRRGTVDRLTLAQANGDTQTMALSPP